MSDEVMDLDFAFPETPKCKGMWLSRERHDALLAENAALKAKIARVEAFANRPYREGFDMTREQYEAVTVMLRAALADEEKAGEHE